jgi:hypothetical protein
VCRNELVEQPEVERFARVIYIGVNAEFRKVVMSFVMLILLFIILLRFLAGIMVWVMIVMVILVLGYGKSLPPCVLPSPLSAKFLCPWSCH